MSVVNKKQEMLLEVSIGVSKPFNIPDHETPIFKLNSSQDKLRDKLHSVTVSLYSPVHMTECLCP